MLRIPDGDISGSKGTPGSEAGAGQALASQHPSPLTSCEQHQETQSFAPRCLVPSPDLPGQAVKGWGLGIHTSDRPPTQVLPGKPSFRRAGGVPGTPGTMPRSGAATSPVHTWNDLFLSSWAHDSPQVLGPMKAASETGIYKFAASQINKQVYFEPSQAVVGSK